MGYFPFFADIKDRPVTVIGGGRVALGKVRRLLPFGPKITVVAPEVTTELESIEEITVIKREFSPEDISGAMFVVAATDDRETNRNIAALCRERNIPVNAVDDKEACSFIFPSVITKGGLTVGISTGGASPAAAVWLKDKINEIIPENFDAILSQLESLRPVVKEKISDEKKRAAVFKKLFAASLEQGGPLSELQINGIINYQG